jgi:hypothetical protein
MSDRGAQIPNDALSRHLLNGSHVRPLTFCGGRKPKTGSMPSGR